MLNSAILDVAIGVIFVFLMTSLIVTASNELIAGFLSSSRAKHLYAGVRQLLNDGDAAALFAHPLVRGLAASGANPSYIPSRTFVQALLDHLARGESSVPGVLAKMNDGPLKDALICLSEEAKGDFDNFKISIEQWFNRAMDRVSGVYKRKTQWVTLGLGAAIALLMNIDAIQIASTIWNDPGTRAALVAAATKAEGDAQQTGHPGLRGRVENLRALPVPIGWSNAKGQSTADEDPGYRVLYSPLSGDFWMAIRFHWLGWLLTAIAASLGSPFWFDVLNKFMNVRAAGTAPEEEPRSPKEIPGPQPPGGP